MSSQFGRRCCPAGHKCDIRLSRIARITVLDIPLFELLEPYAVYIAFVAGVVVGGALVAWVFMLLRIMRG